MEILRLGKGPILAECTNTKKKGWIDLEKKSNLSVKDNQMAKRKDSHTR